MTHFLLCEKMKLKKKPPKSFLSLNSEHLARGPAALMSWKSTEHVHRERRDFERMTHCKQDGRHVPSSACGTSAMSPCAVGGKLAMVSVCSLIGATEHSVACHRPQ